MKTLALCAKKRGAFKNAVPTQERGYEGKTLPTGMGGLQKNGNA
ncbi:MAG: hypothetical protein ACHQQQ_14985 [Bacteroidota bacterium]